MLQKCMRIGGRDMSSKQLKKIKKHKILSTEKKEIQPCIYAGKDRGWHGSTISNHCTKGATVILFESMGLIYTGIQSPKHPWVYRLCLGMLNN